MQGYPDPISAPARRGASPAFKVGVAGAALALLAAVLPWSLNRGDDPGSFVPDPVATIGLFVVGLLAVGGALPLLWRRNRVWPVVLTAFALVAFVLALAFVPVAEIIWDGIDEFGRPTGGYILVTRGPAGFIAVVGGFVATLGALLGLVPGADRPKQPPPFHPSFPAGAQVPQPQAPYPPQPQSPHPPQPQAPYPPQPQSPHPPQPQAPYEPQPQSPHPAQPQAPYPAQPQAPYPPQPQPPHPPNPGPQ